MADMRTLIIGYGSPIRGDDALGPLAADRLEDAGLPDHVEVLSRHILTAELVANLMDKDRAIFLDASVDSEPGEVRCRRLEPEASNISSMAHALDPRELLAWCQTLYGRTPESYLISAGVCSLDYASYQLTPIAESALGRMLETVARLIEAPPQMAATP